VTFRLALDQNYPQKIVRALVSSDAMPEEIELAALRDIDPRLTDTNDRKMIIRLYQLGWQGLATNNYKILRQPRELAALIATKLTFICIQGMGDNSVRATGALLLELPGLPQRLKPRVSNVFYVSHSRKQPTDARSYMQQIARRQSIDVTELTNATRVTAAELATSVWDNG
jgi:hypothetical protein